MIDDPALPGLRDLAPDELVRLTGQPGTALLRLRYRAGERAILHVAGDAGEGVLWFFAGDKGRRIADREPSARWDSASGAVFERFPNDHRLPEIASLLRAWPDVAPQLIGSGADAGLELLRYRPGLSCTFRARAVDRRIAYVKVIGDGDVKEIANANAEIGAALSPAPLEIAPVVGTLPEFKAIAFAAAPGRSLDRLLSDRGFEAALTMSLDALGCLHRIRFRSPRIKDVGQLRLVAEQARRDVVTMFPALAEAAARVLASLDASPPPDTLRQIHGDLKLEHIFVAPGRVTLIDADATSAGPVDYDLAMLAGRVTMARAAGGLPAAAAKDAVAAIAERAGSGFTWCRQVVALRLAKFHAQRPATGAEARAASLLREIP